MVLEKIQYLARASWVYAQSAISKRNRMTLIVSTDMPMSTEANVLFMHPWISPASTGEMLAMMTAEITGRL